MATYTRATRREHYIVRFTRSHPFTRGSRLAFVRPRVSACPVRFLIHVHTCHTPKPAHQPHGCQGAPLELWQGPSVKHRVKGRTERQKPLSASLTAWPTWSMVVHAVLNLDHVAFDGYDTTVYCYSIVSRVLIDTTRHTTLVNWPWHRGQPSRRWDYRHRHKQLAPTIQRYGQRERHGEHLCHSAVPCVWPPGACGCLALLCASAPRCLDSR